jgi:Permuted papain-like amidase enzyme, YaeF/YiiX, C92 family
MLLNSFYRGGLVPLFYYFSVNHFMKILHCILSVLIISIITSCNENVQFPAVDLAQQPPAKDTIQQHIDSLKKISQPGDLVVRLGDDFISDRIRYLSVTDHSYSHAGIVVMCENKKMVCNIYPDDFVPGADTVRYDTIDSFLNRKTNLKCALYRYDLSDSEKINLQEALDDYHKKKIHFDKKYDLKTDDKIYCSEMIYKALKKVTNNRIVIAQSDVPENMQHLIFVYFKKYNFSKNVISSRKIIAIDNLYNNEHCKPIMKFALKDIPKNE